MTPGNNIRKNLILIFLLTNVLCFSESKIIINELLASNSSVLCDADKEYNDWIEIKNPAIYIDYTGLPDSASDN